MTDNSYLNQLQKISKIILEPDLDYAKLRTALDAYKALLIRISEIEAETLNNRENIYLDSGKAIAPEWAIRCIDDMMRTKRFICGVYKAVLNVIERKKNEPIYILYTGTGPFATLVLPLISLFGPEEIQFILVEINTISFAHAKKVFQAFDAEGYISEFHQADAATLKLVSPERIDIHVVECLQHALAREPQVSITYNILSQLNEDVILIPENIELSILQMNTKLQQEHMMNNMEASAETYYLKSEAVFALNKTEVFNNLDMARTGKLIFPKKIIQFANEKTADYNQLAIGTAITVFEDERLDINDSGLTIPRIIARQQDGYRIKGVETQYINSNDPELKTTILK
ncbi:MAG: hypothetical protein KJO77_02705 [Bacteroidia bacterium]|nr:hypothetical protein [Bacteroidia bacterium]